jgi:NAD(P)-dependent dehydrogenase (short-subunit alcohol dehydrogenase family)
MNEARKNVERNAKGEPIVWTIEMAGSAEMARQGISVNTFPPGTIFSTGLHPLRNGQPAGSREGGVFKCPAKTPPAPGKHCDSVAGHTAIGKAPLPTPTK